MTQGAGEPGRVVGNTAGVLDWIDQLAIRHERAFFIAALSLFSLPVAYEACTRPIWFDEFFTLVLSGLPTFSEMLKAMPADGQPPLQYLLTRIALRFISEPEIAVRFPDILAYLCTGMMTYRIVRKHGTQVQALFASVFILGSAVTFIGGFTARPYALLVMFTTLTFWSWQLAASGEKDRLLPLAGVSLGIGGAILSHHFGVLHVGILLAAGEAARLLRRWRVDWGMLVAAGTGLLPLIFTAPMAHRSRAVLGEAVLHSANFWAKPSMTTLAVSYGWMVNLPLLGALAGTVLLWRSRKGSLCLLELPGVPDYEWAATIGLCLLPVGILLFAEVETGYFLPRYAIGASLGLALLTTWGLPRTRVLRARGQSLMLFSTLCCLVALVAVAVRTELKRPIAHARPGDGSMSRVLPAAPPGLSIVVANAFDYVPEWFYAPQDIKSRLVYLTDVPYAQQQTDFLPELSLAADRAYLPLKISSYTAFLVNHRRFLLLQSGKHRLNWTVSRLVQSGGRLKALASSGSDVLYLVEMAGGSGAEGEK